MTSTTEGAYCSWSRTALWRYCMLFGSQIVKCAWYTSHLLIALWTCRCLGITTSAQTKAEPCQPGQWLPFPIIQRSMSRMARKGFGQLPSFVDLLTLQQVYPIHRHLNGIHRLPLSGYVWAILQCSVASAHRHLAVPMFRLLFETTKCSYGAMTGNGGGTSHLYTVRGHDDVRAEVTRCIPGTSGAGYSQIVLLRIGICSGSTPSSDLAHLALPI